MSVSVRLSPIRDGDRVTGVSLIYRDLTDSRRILGESRSRSDPPAVA